MIYIMRNVSNPQKDGKKNSKHLPQHTNCCFCRCFCLKKNKKQHHCKENATALFLPNDPATSPRSRENFGVFNAGSDPPPERSTGKLWRVGLGVGVACFKQRLVSDKLQYHIQNKNSVCISILFSTILPIWKLQKKQQIHL